MKYCEKLKHMAATFVMRSFSSVNQKNKPLPYKSLLPATLSNM